MKRKKSNRPASSSIEEALAVFFTYVAQRNEPDWSAEAENPPAEVLAAFSMLVDYYARHLARVLRVSPCNRISVFCQTADVFNHAFERLWSRGHEIMNRTPSGVGAWLKTVVSNYRRQMWRKFGNELKSTSYLNHTWQDDETDQSQERLLRRRVGQHLSDTRLGAEESEFRCNLLIDLYLEARSLLLPRQQEVLELSDEGKTMAQIRDALDFPSIDSAKSFKWRASEALKTAVLELIAEKIDDPDVDLIHKSIFEDWLDYGTQVKKQVPA